MRGADRLRPDDATILVGLGALQLARHDFGDALEIGRRAVELAPGLPRRTASSSMRSSSSVGTTRRTRPRRGCSRSPTTSARSRASRTCASSAVTSRPPAPRWPRPPTEAPRPGEPGVRARDPRQPRAVVRRSRRRAGGLGDGARPRPEPPAVAGRAGPAGHRRGPPRRGDRPTWPRSSRRCPLPEYVIALGEVQEAAGHERDAEGSFDLARFQIELFEVERRRRRPRARAVRSRPRRRLRALELAEAAWDETPTVRAADAVAWALHRLGRDDDAREWSERALGSARRAAPALPRRRDRRGARGRGGARAASSRTPSRPTPASPRPAPPRRAVCSTPSTSRSRRPSSVTG